MKRLGAVLAAAAVATLGTFAVASPASATTEPILVESGCLTEWYVNPDEGDRQPESTEDGLVFEPADLVHHAVDIPLKELTVGGTFTAAPDPGENFRFSVEIINPGGTGYATLHWTGTTWFIGGATTPQEAADPETFIGYVHKWGAIGADSRVISFGVGYTKNPPGEVETTVTEVEFNGETYDLTCAPVPTETETTATCIDLNTASVEELEGIVNIGPERAPEVVAMRPIASVDKLLDVDGIGDVLLAEIKAEHAYCDIAAPTTQAPAAATLPVTGPGTTGIIVTGAALVIGGTLLIVLMRKRRDHEQPQA